MTAQSPSEKPRRMIDEPPMRELIARHSRETAALYEMFFELYPQFKNEAYEDDTSPEHDEQYRAYIRESGILERHDEERRQLIAIIRAERKKEE